MVDVSPVSHNLHPPSHLSDSEETEHLGKDHAAGSKLGSIEVSYAAKDRLWSPVGTGSAVQEGVGVSDGA
jgi:hypothetical protein